MRCLAIAVVALAGCTDDISLGDNGFGPDFTVVTDIDPINSEDVDVLFLIDSSGSMAEEQLALTSGMRDQFFGVLDISYGARPNMHVGVASLDLGAGPHNISGCSGEGDDGALENTPRIEGCTPPDGRFLVDLTGVDGRVTNYAGDIEDSFACIARLGIAGCGFEQPLEAMKRALDGHREENAGFLRPHAQLAVVIVTDEDDCSTFDRSMFDTSQNSMSDPLGPLSSFRCFEFGVQCEDDEPREPGSRELCVGRQDSPYMAPVERYADFLKELKPDPTKVVVTAIIGPPSPVVVSTNATGHAELNASCSGPMGNAAPGVRLAEFASHFHGRSTWRSVCDETLSRELLASSSVIAGAGTGSPCLLGALGDVEPTTAGLQYDCRVYDAPDRGTDYETRIPIPACADDPSARPCFEIEADPASCAHTETGLAVSVIRNAAPPGDTHTLVRCKLPDHVTER